MARAEPSSGSRISETAPAKINLYLHVTGCRADGFHLLDSLVAFADAGDEVDVAAADRLDLTLSGPFAGALGALRPEDNLVLRAARLLRREGGVGGGAAIRLRKTLPVAAGLGGGSADAAAALRALARLWRLRPGRDDLTRIGLELGADVPVCLGGQAAFVGGIGEELEPAPALPTAGLVLVNPGMPLATSEMFGALGRIASRPARFAEIPADAAALAEILDARRNDLETPAKRLAPVVAEVRDALMIEAGCLIARMSGSGATCFGLFAGLAEAAQAARRIAAARPVWWVAAASLINRFATARAAE